MRRSAITLTAMLLLMQGMHHALAAPVAEVDTILAKMQKAAASVTSIKASFHEDRQFGSVGGHEQYDGEIYFKHGGSSGDKVRVKSLKGSTVTADLWVNGNDAVFYQPQMGQAIRTTTDKQPAQHPEYGFITNPYMSVPKMKALYNITYTRDENLPSGSNTAVLQLYPKQKSALTQLVIWVDRSSWLPVKYQASQTNGDILTYSLSSITVNKPPIPDSTFKPDLPKGISYAIGARVDELDTVLASMQKAGSNLTTIQTNFHEDRHFGSIGGGEQYDGQIYFKHGGRTGDKVRLKSLRGNTVTEDLWVNGNTATFYQPQAHQAIITTTDKQAKDHPEYGFIANPYMSVPKMKAQYKITYQGDDSLPAVPKTAVLQLIPNQQSVVTRLTIWVDRSSWLPVKYQTNQSNGDVLTYTLSGIVVNKPVQDSVFSPSLPPGTKIIRQ